MNLLLSTSEARKVQKVLSAAADPELAEVCERLSVMIRLDVLNARLATLEKKR